MRDADVLAKYFDIQRRAMPLGLRCVLSSSIGATMLMLEKLKPSSIPFNSISFDSLNEVENYLCGYKRGVEMLKTQRKKAKKS